MDLITGFVGMVLLRDGNTCVAELWEQPFDWRFEGAAEPRNQVKLGGLTAILQALDLLLAGLHQLRKLALCELSPKAIFPNFVWCLHKLIQVTGSKTHSSTGRALIKPMT